MMKIMDKQYIFINFLLLLLLPLHVLSVDVNARDVRLSADSIPSKYSLDLILDPRATTYDGLVEITFTAKNAVKNLIQLHASAETLDIKSALLNYEHSCTVTDHDATTDIITFECPKDSLQQENTLTIKFQGTYVTEYMNGLYKSTYRENYEDIVLVATDFEPTDARKAFPCFDEPILKATFDIFITHPNDYNVLSNTPTIKQFSTGPEQTQTQFKTTPKMSTYLVAFVVSKFVSSSNSENSKYDDKVFSRPRVKQFTNVATNYGPTLIKLLSEWTGIDYNDLGNTQAYQVAIPDFQAGAMENWGLITFREVELLDEEDTTPYAAKQRIITTVAHELSHQWFGDYVTLDWWSDTWLNEGFATYFEYFIPSLLEDNLDTMRQFVVEELQPVLQVDALPSAFALTSDVNTDAEIDDKFDDISYSKGGSVIRMLKNSIGETAFKKGLNHYLSANKYNVGSPSRLLSSFQTYTAIDIDRIMNNWIFKPGFPLVTAKLNGSTVIVTQERFTVQNSSDIEKTEWYVPISYTTGKEKNFNINITDWLEPNSQLEIELEDNSWIILNIQQAGYFRVNYDSTLWQRLIDALKKESSDFDDLNRAQLVDDVFNIAKAGKVSYETAFELAEFLKEETEYYPWVSALNAMSFISGKLNDAEAEKLLKSKILSWINKASSTKIDTTQHIEMLKDVLILDWACKIGQEECNTYANENFKKFKQEYTLPDYNRRSILFCYGLRNSDNPSDDYDFLFDFFKTTPSVIAQNEILNALGCTQDTEILTKYLTETITENSPIRKQDTRYVYKAVYSQGEVGLNASLSFLENNLDKIATRYKGMSALSNLVLGVANNIVSDDHINRLTKLINENPSIEALKSVGQKAIDIAATNRNWTDTYAAEIKKILKTEPSQASISEPTFTFFIMAFSVFYLFNSK